MTSLYYNQSREEEKVISKTNMATVDVRAENTTIVHKNP